MSGTGGSGDAYQAGSEALGLNKQLKTEVVDQLHTGQRCLGIKPATQLLSFLAFGPNGKAETLDKITHVDCAQGA